jgi:hypothetical protein
MTTTILSCICHVQIPCTRNLFRVAQHLRAEEDRRLHGIVLAPTNNVPIRLGEGVDGGSYSTGIPSAQRGVVAGSDPPQDRRAVSPTPNECREKAVSAASDSLPLTGKVRATERHHEVIRFEGIHNRRMENDLGEKCLFDR